MMTHEYKMLCRLLKERCGIELGDDKMDLVDAKLRPLVKEQGFPSLAHLTLALMQPDADRLRSRVVQSIAVLESYFFRDKTPFQYFAEVMLPRLMERRRASRRIRIWCAAASTGQEPYSLAMLVADAADRLKGWTVEIVATDFVEDALRKAREGVYSQFEVQRGLPVSKLVKYFQKEGSGWRLNPDIRSKVAFRDYNLLDDCQQLGTFDIIFCRNVLIYFDERLKHAVLARLAGQLASDGYLVLGAAETTTGHSPDFTPVPEGHHGVFCLTPAAAESQAERQARRLRAVAASASRGQSADESARTVALDEETAALLEARAKARGISVAELLAEYATEFPDAERRRTQFKVAG
jgi:chemotaxis protein methyltransferase CheR